MAAPVSTSAIASDIPEIDGVASMLIGVLLAATAVLLVRESRGLLIGEGVRGRPRAVRKIVRGLAPVHEVGRPLSMYIGRRKSC